jgi:tetratricopeptide (TPR) repeat protein
MLEPGNFPAGEAVRGFEQVVARAPQFAEAHGQLALSLYRGIPTTPPAEVEPLLARAEREARLSLRIDRGSSASAYGTLWSLARHRNEDIAPAEQEFLLTPMATQDQPWIAMFECRLQLEVGRPGEALRFCQRAMIMRPLSPQVGYSYALALNMAGDPARAQEVMDRMYRYFPEHDLTRRVLFELVAFGDHPERALGMLDGMMARDLTPEGGAALRLLLRARRSATAADTDRAVAALQAAVRAGRLDARYLIRGAAVLRRPDEAFAALNALGLRANNDLGYLFSPSTASLRRDPRFWPVAAGLGYVKYWRTRGMWPDFCSDPAFNVDCKREAARVSPVVG